ncbi:HGxxPAAW family protein [Streptomyces sp. NPDC047085]|uniref:HGxxPAAW family protein n=1 Tax=Streptomyces sp. NPDC047085 TaxID=3155140 RepID=UPI0033E71600
MSGIHGDYDMGHTVAGWTGTVICLVGLSGTGAAMCVGSSLGLWAGLATVVLSALVTWGLHLAGWGKPTGPRPREEWPWQVKDPMTAHADCLGCRMAGRAGRARRREGTPELTAAAAPAETS